MKCRLPSPPALVVLLLAWIMARLSSSRPAEETVLITGDICCNSTTTATIIDLITTTIATSLEGQRQEVELGDPVDVHPNLNASVYGQSTDSLDDSASRQPLPLDHQTSAPLSTAAASLPQAASDHPPPLAARTPATPEAFPAPMSDDYVDYYYYQEMDYGYADTGASSDNHTTRRHPSSETNRIAKLKLIRRPRRHPPEYMLDLYDRFSRAHAAPAGLKTTSAAPEDDIGEDDLSADIVRSFPNINKEDTDSEASDGLDLAGHKEQLPGVETRYHTLVFNVTSLLLSGEHVSRAELRLYTLVARDRHTYQGRDRLVTVYEGLGMRTLPPVTSRHVYGHASGWEAFDVTEVIKHRVESGSRSKMPDPGPAAPEVPERTVENEVEEEGPDDGVQVLEVSIATVFQPGHRTPATDMDIDVDPEHDQGPLLVVFSRDTHRHRHRELQTLIGHEPESEDLEGTIVEHAHGTGPANDVSAIRKYRDTRAIVARSNLTDWEDSEENDVPLRRFRREKRKRNSCRRTPLYVDFQEINWHQWIIAPPGYQAFECVGKCYVPIGSHLSPTKHAIIQTLMHAAHPKRASRACCVPTKLDPISILYLDENGVITYKYHYDGMVVAECGCR